MTQPEAEELKPCRQCGYSIAQRLFSQTKHFDAHRIACGRCGYSTETKATQDEADKAWQTRAHLATLRGGDVRRAVITPLCLYLDYNEAEANQVADMVIVELENQAALKNPSDAGGEPIGYIIGTYLDTPYYEKYGIALHKNKSGMATTPVYATPPQADTPQAVGDIVAKIEREADFIDARSDDHNCGLLEDAAKNLRIISKELRALLTRPAPLETPVENEALDCLADLIKLAKKDQKSATDYELIRDRSDAVRKALSRKPLDL